MKARALAPLAVILLALPALATLPPVAGVDEPAWVVWNAETVSTGDVGWPSPVSLALRADDEVSILYIDRWEPGQDRTSIWLAERSGLAWTLERLEFNSAPGAIAADSDDSLQVAYRRNVVKDLPGNNQVVAPDLGYAKRVNGVWSFETAELYGTTDGVWRAHIAVDANNRPHILYDTFGNLLKYATKETNGSWTIETISNGFYEWSDIRIDQQGRPHVVWSKGNGPSEFRYSIRTGANTWETEVVSGSKAYLAFDLDGNDRPHVAARIPGGGLGYFRNTSGTWEYELAVSGSELVPSRTPGNVGFDPSIAIDAAGHPHIAFGTRSSGSDNILAAGQLQYTAKINGSWHVETADRGGFDIAYLTSIKVDGDGLPRVAYILNTRFWSRSCGDPLNTCHDLKYAEPLLATARAATP